MRIAVVQAPTGSAPLHDLRRSTPSGLTLELVFQRSVAEGNPRLIEAAQRLFEVSVVSDDPWQVDLGRWGGVVTFADPMLEFTDVLRARMGARGAVEGAWDKNRQRRVLADHGLSKLRSATVRGVEQLQSTVRDLGLPLVVKPLRGAGGAGVRAIRSPEQFARLLDGHRGGTWHAEQLIEEATAITYPWMGRLLSLEIATAAPGNHHHLATFGKFPIQSVSAGLGGDSGAPYQGETLRVCGDINPSGLPEELENEVRALCFAALDALGVGWRLTHTEVLLGADGPEIVEINGRVGGFLSRVLARTGGVDLIGTCLELTAGVLPGTTRPPRPQGAAAGFFPSFASLDGTVASSTLHKRDLLGVAGVVGVETLARPDQTYSSLDGRMANLVLAADDLDALGETFAEVVAVLDEGFAADGGLVATWPSPTVPR